MYWTNMYLLILAFIGVQSCSTLERIANKPPATCQVVAR